MWLRIERSPEEYPMRATDQWLSIPLAVLVIATTSPAWSREKPIRHHRTAVSQRVQSDPTASQKEPFTAEEKRRFQAPTGHEVDRW